MSVRVQLPVQDPEAAQLLQADRAGGLGAVRPAGVGGGVVQDLDRAWARAGSQSILAE